MNVIKAFETARDTRSSAKTVHFCRASPPSGTRSTSLPGLWSPLSLSRSQSPIGAKMTQVSLFLKIRIIYWEIYILFFAMFTVTSTIEFLNLLSMKPVFDSKGVFSYLIGVHYVFTPEMKVRGREIQLVDDLLYSLSNVLE